MTVFIEGAELMKTQKLLGTILTYLNDDKRVMFYTSPGRGAATVQCLRVMLSRVRVKLKNKGIRRKHFKLHADVTPHTMLDGTRRDGIVMWRSRSGDHEVLETLEDLLSNGTASQLDAA